MRYLDDDNIQKLLEGYAQTIAQLDLSRDLVIKGGRNLSSEKAKSYSIYGLARRLTYIKYCVSRFFDDFQVEAQGREIPDRTRNEQTIHLNFFFVCLAGALDNLAWMFNFERDLNLGKFDVTLLKSKLRETLSGEFNARLEQLDNWLRNHLPEFRDPSAHRIMPYVVPHIEFDDGTKCFDSYYVHDFDESPQMKLHPQIICDASALCDIVDWGMKEFNLKVARVTAPMNEEDFKKEASALIKKHSPQVSDEQIELHNDSTYYWGPENFSQTADWLRRAEEILKDPSKYSNADVFINFFGLIDDTEIFAFLKEKSVGSMSAMGYSEADMPKAIAGIKDPETKKYFELIWQAKNLFEPVQSQFSEDDKFLLRFLRHRHCHAILSNFGVKIAGKGQDAKFKTANWERLVGLSKTTTVRDFRQSLLAKLGPHRETIGQIAKLLTPEPSGRLLPE